MVNSCAAPRRQACDGAVSHWEISAGAGGRVRFMSNWSSFLLPCLWLAVFGIARRSPLLDLLRHERDIRRWWKNCWRRWQTWFCDCNKAPGGNFLATGKRTAVASSLRLSEFKYQTWLRCKYCDKGPCYCRSSALYKLKRFTVISISDVDKLVEYVEKLSVYITPTQLQRRPPRSSKIGNQWWRSNALNGHQQVEWSNRWQSLLFSGARFRADEMWGVSVRIRLEMVCVCVCICVLTRVFV